jgi:hypothetical protein
VDTGQGLFPHATKPVLLTFSKNYGTLEVSKRYTKLRIKRI